MKSLLICHVYSREEDSALRHKGESRRGREMKVLGELVEDEVGKTNDAKGVCLV